MTDLDLNTEIVCEVIQKAREFHAKEEVSFPEDEPMHSDDSDWLQVLADHQSDMTYQEAVDAINNLEPDQQIKLVALMYVGRGDFDTGEWDEALEEAQRGWTLHTAEYLLSRPMVADHLEEGLALFGYYCE